MKFPLFSLPRLLVAALTFAFAPLAVFAQSVLPNGQVGVSYSFQVTTNPPAAAGSVYSAMNLPAGLGINASSGLISGTPSTAGTIDGTVSVTSSGTTDNFAIRITILAAAGAPAITSATTASGTAGTAFATYTVTASNSPTSFNIGMLPAGLTVGGTATAPTIIGTPATAGTYQVALSANNASGTGTTTTLTIAIAAASGTPVITSAATVSAAVGAAMTPYQITGTNSPTSFFASGLPQGVTLNSGTGLISGTPTVSGTYPVAVNASNASGTGSTATITFTIGAVSTITSATSASGTVGTSFNYTLSASNTPTSFNIGTLPAGLAANTTSGAITGTPTTAGVTSVSVSANNAAGSGPAVTLSITIGAATVTPPPPPPITPPPPPAVIAPAITAHPSSQSVLEGASVTMSVSATGTSLAFQWRKNGTVITGATANTLTFSSVTVSDAGSYTVTVSNSASAVTSNAGVLSVTGLLTPPVITTQPIAQTTTAGANVTFSVVATGTTPLSYQWRKDGVAIAGANSASLVLTGVTASSLGNYSVVVSNTHGSVTSNSAALAFTGFAGTYFGTFGGTGGLFALHVRGDGTGVFLGFARAGRVALVNRDVLVGADGRFSVTVPLALAAATAVDRSTPPVAAHEGEYHIDGSIGAGGSVAGTVSSLNLTLAAPASTPTNTTAALAGFYQAGAAGSSAVSYTIIGRSGEAFVMTVNGASVDAGRGTIDAAGRLDITTDSSARVSGTTQAASAMITLTATPLAGAATTFIGANNDARSEVENLINISTRAQTGTATNVLIAGFVITGDQSKPVLIRAIGPSLAQFNLTGVLSAARLEVFRGSASIAVGTDWGAGPNPTLVAVTATRVGAFALPANSRDAALLVTLPPGAYTAIVTGQGGAAGVALVEAYDATDGPVPRAQRIINISTRATAGAGESTLIAGFVITGTVPKRVLVRGAGPALAQFGLTGVLARPQIAVFSGSTVLVQNAGWSTSPDASAIAAAATQAGAFAFPATSQDAALIVNLAPGAYTAQLSGVGGTAGIALVEVYEF